MTPSDPKLAGHAVVSREAWLAARLRLLEGEKELSRQADRIAAQRRTLPWVRIEKAYAFETPAGRRTLSELFEGRRQLVVQHFMLGPGWEEGCKSCSFMADHTDGALPHLAARDVSFTAISRAPLADIEVFKRRMGWRFAWASSFGGEFNADFGVSFTPERIAAGDAGYNYGAWNDPGEEMPGISVFVRDDDGSVFHTYSTYGRGVELMMHTYRFLDLVPKGRDEEGLEHTMAWVRHHDRYEQPAAGCCGAHAR